MCQTGRYTPLIRSYIIYSGLSVCGNTANQNKTKNKKGTKNLNNKKIE